MLLVGNTKFTTRYGQNNGAPGEGGVTDDSEYERGDTTTGLEDDSGNEDDDEDLDRSEEILLPEDDEEEEDDDAAVFELQSSPLHEDDEEILYRQMAYPPLPEYIPPLVDYQNHYDNYSSSSSNSSSSSKKVVSKKKADSRIHPRERLGVLTPMEEVTEPPSSAGTEASAGGVYNRNVRNEHKKTDRRQKNKIQQRKNNKNDSEDQQKSILKSTSPVGSPERRRAEKVKFMGAGSATHSERSVSPSETSISTNSPQKSERMTDGGVNSAIEEETEEKVDDQGESSINNEDNVDPIMEQLNKVETWQLGNDKDNPDPLMSAIDAEFASILDDIIAELHSWDRLAGTGASITEINASRQDHLANVSSNLTNYLGQIHPLTVMSNLPQLIPLITSLLSLTAINFRAQLSSLNAVNIFSDRLKDCKTQTGLKKVPNADLTWLVRTLCDISSESSRSVLKSVATAALASLVKSAGPEMICEPILLILMGNDEKVPKRPEGSGNIVTTGGVIPGGPPKTKATALDTLTFALLTFPRDAFDLDTVARLACHCLLHSKRRVRQASLECLAVVAHSLTPGVALPLFRKYISEEETAIYNDILNSQSFPSPPPSPKKIIELANHYDSELDIANVLGPPSKIPLPIRVLEQKVQTGANTNHPQQQQPPPSPPGHKPKSGPTPASAISARISRRVLPIPNLEELVEYGVKIPANSQLLSRQSVKVGGQEESCEESSSTITGLSASGVGKQRVLREQRLSSGGGESCSSVSNIEYTFLELEPVLNNTHGSGGGRGRRAHNGGSSSSEVTMAPDIEWVLMGSGAIKQCDPSTLLPKDLSILASGTTKYQQWNNNLGAASTVSGNESDFNSSVSNNQTTRNFGSSGGKLNMKRIGSTRNDLLQDAFVQEPVIGRYYYPPPTSHIIPSPRTNNLTGSDRFSSKSSYNLLPNKYSVLRNNNQYRGGVGNNHDLISPHVLLPGAAYDNNHVNGYGHNDGGDMSSTSSTGGHWHSDLGSLSKINLKPKPLEPIHSLREKYFESARKNESLRSDSPQSTGDEEEENDNEAYREPEHEKTDQHKPIMNPKRTGKPPTAAAVPQRNQNVNSRKPPMAPRPNPTMPSRDEASVRRQTEMLVNGNIGHATYQVYHSRVDIDNPLSRQQGPIKSSSTNNPLSPPINTTTTLINKRGDVDSAGSNHTRDSGVSLGSVGSSKTPPSVHNTPPTQHRNSPSSGQTNNSAQHQLNRNWQSTPDVPLDLNADMERSRERNLSGSSSSSSRNGKNPTKVSASDENMPVHRKPVLARRGQSMTRAHEVSQQLPPMKYSGPSTRRDHSGTRNGGSGDHLLPDDDGYHHSYNQSTNNMLSSSESELMRNSVSTGNLAENTTETLSRSRIPISKSSYFENGNESNEINQRTGRVSSRREGPFGDVRASIDIEDNNGAATLPSRRNVGKGTGRIVPTKVYKGSFREINSRKGSNGSNKTEVFPSDLKPVTSPKHALPMALGQLDSADWETNVDGYRQIVRMIRFDPEFIRNDLHNINIAGIKHLSNLRSQVCRAAILCFEELFSHLGRSMEPDCEKIAEKLLDKCCDTNKFIREASSRALEAMMINLTPFKGLTCLDLFGTRHRNPAVKCVASGLTAKLVEQVGVERSLGELGERLLPMLCKLLQEGSLETRTSAKSAIAMLKPHPSFAVLLRRHVSETILRNVQKNIDTIKF